MLWGIYQFRAVKNCSLAVPDGIVVYNTSLQHNINVWEEELTKTAMNINIKSLAIVISVDKSNHQILVENNLFQGVERFKLYLGSVSSASSKVNEKIKERTRAANCLLEYQKNSLTREKSQRRQCWLEMMEALFNLDTDR